MGIVYDAWQGSMQRRVALKVLSPAVTHVHQAVQRFRREARAAGPLPEAPDDLYAQVGPWDLVRDPRRPVVGDCALLAGHVLWRLTAWDEAVDWVAQVRRRGLAWRRRPCSRRPPRRLLIPWCTLLLMAG